MWHRRCLLLTLVRRTGCPDTESVHRSLFCSQRFQPGVMGEPSLVREQEPAGPPEERASLATCQVCPQLPLQSRLTSGPRVADFIPAAEASAHCRMGLLALTGSCPVFPTTRAHLSSLPEGKQFCTFCPVLPPLTVSVRAHSCSQDS